MEGRGLDGGIAAGRLRTSSTPHEAQLLASSSSCRQVCGPFGLRGVKPALHPYAVAVDEVRNSLEVIRELGGVWDLLAGDVVAVERHPAVIAVHVDVYQ